MAAMLTPTPTAFCGAGALVTDLRDALRGSGQPKQLRTLAIFLLAVICAISPLDTSQLVMLLLGAAAYALSCPVSVVAKPGKARPALPRKDVGAAACFEHPERQGRGRVDSAVSTSPSVVGGGASVHARASNLRRRSSPTQATPRPGLQQCTTTTSAVSAPGASSDRFGSHQLQLQPTSPSTSALAPTRTHTVKPVAAPCLKAQTWDDQVAELVSQLSTTPAGEAAVQSLAAQVQQALRVVVPEVEVSGFASGALLRNRAFAVAVPDVDLVVNCPPNILVERLQAHSTTANRHGGAGGGVAGLQKQLQKASLRAFTDRLLETGDFKFRRSAFSAREPKVTLLPVGEGEHCVPVDIMVNAATPFHHAALLTDIGHMDARAKALVLFVRRWARDRGVCHAAKGSFSPYCWTLLTIFFLQVGAKGQEGSLPSIDKFQLSSTLLASAPSKREKPLARSTSTCESVASTAESDSLKSVGALFSDFVEFYQSNFDFSKEAVSVQWGQRSNASQLLKGQAPTTVEDPFEPCRNLAASVTAEGLSRTREEFSRAAALVRSPQGSVAALLEPWAPQESQEQ